MRNELISMACHLMLRRRFQHVCVANFHGPRAASRGMAKAPPHLRSFPVGCLQGHSRVDQTWKPGLASVDPIEANHSRTTNGDASSKLLEAEARSVLLDQCLAVEIGAAIACEAFNGNNRIAEFADGQLAIGIFSHR